MHGVLHPEALARRLQLKIGIASNFPTRPNWSPTMSAAARSSEQLQNDTPSELNELQRAIDSLPAQHRLTLLPAFQRVVESTNRRRKILQLVQEALGQLRLDMKYLVFDLEATRRERDTYQQQIREWTGESTSDDEGKPADDE